MNTEIFGVEVGEHNKRTSPIVNAVLKAFFAWARTHWRGQWVVRVDDMGLTRGAAR